MTAADIMQTVPMPNDERSDSGDSALWIPEDSKFGVVRAVVISGKYAAQFDDLNSDYREVCLTVFRRARSSWQAIVSVDDAGYPDRGDKPVYGYSDGYAWAVGRANPQAQVEVVHNAKTFKLRPNAEGWWLFVRRSRPPKDWIWSPDSFLKFIVD